MPETRTLLAVAQLYKIPHKYEESDFLYCYDEDEEGDSTND